MSGRPRIEISDADIDWLRANYPAHTIRELARKLGCSEATVGRVMHEHGLLRDYSGERRSVEPAEQTRSHRQWTPAEHSRFLSMISEGYTYEEMSAALGRSLGALKQRKSRSLPCEEPVRTRRKPCD